MAPVTPEWVRIMLFFAMFSIFDMKNAFGFSADAVTLKGDVTAPMIKQSIPVMIEKALFAYGKTIINTMAASYGALMVGALGVSNNLGGITTNPQAGFQDGTSAVISQNFGAKRYDRVLKAALVCAAFTMFSGALLGWYFEKKYVNFSTENMTAKKQLLRCVIGLLITGAIYFVIGFVTKKFLDLRLAKYLETIFAAFGAVYLAPLVFHKIEKN